MIFIMWFVKKKKQTNKKNKTTNQKNTNQKNNKTNKQPHKPNQSEFPKMDRSLDVICFPRCHGFRTGEPSKGIYFIREM